HSDARLSMSSQDTNAGATPGNQLNLDLYALRNAAGIVMLVSDQATGKLYYTESKSWQERSTINSYKDGMTPAATFSWDGTDASGKALPGGTKVRVDVYAWLDTDTDAVTAGRKNGGTYRWLTDDAFAGYRELSFPLTLDGQSPTVSAAFSGDKKSVTLTLRDDRHLAYASVADQRRMLLGEKVFFPTAAGESGTLTVSFPDGTYPGTLYIQAEDYAGNTAGYTLDVKALAAGTPVTAKPCGMVLLEDADLSAWYHDAVDYVLIQGIMEANKDMKFRPGENATRAEIVKALYQANGNPASNLAASDLPFRDVSSRAVYAGAVCWAYENGLVNGQTDTTFNGAGSVSRQQMAVMLWRCARLDGTLGGASLAAYPDRDRVASWARPAMTWAVSQGIINGQDGQLNPEGPVTRAQAAQMLMQFLER
ncbi:MAG: S-layer homology domain-containing protein, partial [Oscillospiraceae bacterium]|nr:S-layer homology domain-containing protein [Oscillospiraceae bacterium]